MRWVTSKSDVPNSFQSKTEETGQIHGNKYKAYKKTAKTVKVATRTVQRWVQDFEVSQFISDSKRGRHSKTSSPILDNPDFREKFKDYVRQNSRVPGKN